MPPQINNGIKISKWDTLVRLNAEMRGFEGVDKSNCNNGAGNKNPSINNREEAVATWRIGQ